MRSFEVSRDISAASAQVWALLTDVGNYPGWNPAVRSVEGRAAPGERLIVRATGVDQTFPVRVTAFDPPRRMAWTGGMPLGLFKGERTFDVTETGADACRFQMREAFTGPLSPLIAGSIPDLQPMFEVFADALKRRAEGGEGV